MINKQFVKFIIVHDIPKMLRHLRRHIANYFFGFCIGISICLNIFKFLHIIIITDFETLVLRFRRIIYYDTFSFCWIWMVAVDFIEIIVKSAIFNFPPNIFIWLVVINIPFKNKRIVNRIKSFQIFLPFHLFAVFHND